MLGNRLNATTSSMTDQGREERSIKDNNSSNNLEAGKLLRDQVGGGGGGEFTRGKHSFFPQG